MQLFSTKYQKKNVVLHIKLLDTRNTTGHDFAHNTETNASRKLKTYLYIYLGANYHIILCVGKKKSLKE